VELPEGNTTAGLGANSVVYVDEENGGKYDSVRLGDPREVIICPEIEEQQDMILT
jgi:hypothetical protein